MTLDIIPIYRYNVDMLKNYLNDKGISIYSLAKESGVPYSTLNDIANGRVEVDNCRVSVIRKLSDCLGVSMDELYELCLIDWNVELDDVAEKAEVFVKNKTFYTSFEYEHEKKTIPICSVREDEIRFISDLARWEIEDYIDSEEWRKANEILVNEKKR